MNTGIATSISRLKMIALMMTPKMDGMIGRTRIVQPIVTGPGNNEKASWMMHPGLRFLAIVFSVVSMLGGTAIAAEHPGGLFAMGMPLKEFREAFAHAKTKPLPDGIKEDKAIIYHIDRYLLMGHAFQVDLVFKEARLAMINYYNLEDLPFATIEEIAERFSKVISKSHGDPKVKSDATMVSRILQYEWDANNERVSVSGWSAGPTEELARTSVGVHIYRKGTLDSMPD